MKQLRLALAGLLALLTASSAVAQTFPTIPSQSVIGRLGVPGTSGPSQAIPFATLYSNLFTSLCTTAGAFPIYNATTATWVCSTVGGTGSQAVLNGRLTLNGTPAYDLASNVLGVGIFVPLNSATQTVAASKNWSGLRFTQSDGTNISWTLGSAAVVTNVYSNLTAALGSSSNSSAYGGIFHGTNAGPGTTRGIHAGAYGLAGSTGFISSIGFDIQPVATNAGAWGSFASLNSSGVNGLAIAYGIETSGDTYQLGVGSSVAPVGYTQAAYRAWMATASAANARAYQVLNNGGSEVGYIHKDGTFQSGLAGTQTGSMGFSGATSGTATVTAQAAAGTPTLSLPTATGTLVSTASSPLSINATTGAISIVGAAGQVPNGATGAFTATPTLGASGTLGSLTFGNATSGLLTLQAVTGALGTVTVSLPAATDTLVGKATTDELTNKTLTSSVGKGTWTASGTWTLPAFTLGGTVSGGGNQINNVIIGTSTPLAGTFTTLSASTSVTSSTFSGGSAAGSTILFQSTTNGSPSGDSTVFRGSSHFFQNTAGGTTYLSMTSTVNTMNQATAATSSSTGALVLAGANAGLGVAGAGWFGTYVNITPTVVNSLPSCVAGIDGARAYVTNNNTATAFAGAVTTGGANRHPVYCDGNATAWKQGALSPANDNILAQRKYA